MKRILAGTVTAGILLIVLWISRGRTPAVTRGGAADPEECIERMFAAAEEGDVAAYLACFTGPERERLNRDLQSQSQERFASSLVEAVRRLKGRAVYPSPDTPATEVAAAFTIERIYQGRTDRQDVRLAKDGAGWRIHTVGASRAIQPLVPYGAPVFETPVAAPQDTGK